MVAKARSRAVTTVLVAVAVVAAFGVGVGVLATGPAAGDAIDRGVAAQETTVANETRALTIQNLSAPSRVQVGEEYTVESDLVNPTDGEAVRQVTYRIEGTVIASELVEIAADSTERVVFNVTANDTSAFPPRTFTHGVYTRESNVTANLTFVAAGETTTAPGETTTGPAATTTPVETTPSEETTAPAETTTGPAETTIVTETAPTEETTTPAETTPAVETTPAADVETTPSEETTPPDEETTPSEETTTEEVPETTTEPATTTEATATTTEPAVTTAETAATTTEPATATTTEVTATTTEPAATTTETATAVETTTPAARSASVTFPDQRSTGETVTVESVTVPEGGFVVVHDTGVVEGDAVESILGRSNYLASGTSENVTVPLEEPLNESQRLVAIVYRDSNENRTFDFVSSNRTTDGPYTVASGREAVNDIAFVELQDSAGNETATTA